MRCRGALSFEARRAEKDYRVLNLLAAKARQRFLILGQDSQDASIGTVEEGFVLIRQRRGLERVGHEKLSL